MRNLNCYCKLYNRNPGHPSSFQENPRLQTNLLCASTKVPKFDLIQVAAPGSLPGCKLKSPFSSYPIPRARKWLTLFQNSSTYPCVSLAYPYSFPQTTSPLHSCCTGFTLQLQHWSPCRQPGGSCGHAVLFWAHTNGTAILVTHQPHRTYSFQRCQKRHWNATLKVAGGLLKKNDKNKIKLKTP